MTTNDEINTPCKQSENRHTDCDGELASYSIGLCACSCHNKEAAARAEGYKEGQIDTVKWISKAIKELDDKLINPDYDDLKAVIEAVQKQFKVD